MKNIVFLDRATLSKNIIIPKPKIAHLWQEYANSTVQQAQTRLGNAQVAIVNKVPIKAKLLETLPKLELICVAATGVNNIDLPACKELGIAVCNIQNYAKHTVPEHVFALLLNLRRKLKAYHQDIQAGLWQQSENFCLMHHPIEDLYGQTLGIIGQGSIGQQLAIMAKAFGMKIIFSGRKGELNTHKGKVEFNAFLQQSDVISVHCPLTNETKDLIGQTELTQMKKNAIIINTARGGIVNELALANALNNGEIAGAGVDVLSQEPPIDGNPLLKIAHLPQVIITPHNAWASTQAQQGLVRQLIDNIDAYYGNTPQNRVL